MEKLKKVYKIGDTIEENELLKVAEGITKKALKVIGSSGNMYAFDILEGKDADTFEDLCQNVIIALLENNYVISKECYKIINAFLYNYKKSKMILCLDAEEQNEEIDKNCYIEYITKDYTQEKTQKSNVLNLKSIYNILTPRQSEILKIYCNIGNITKTAEFLGVSRQAVQNALHDTRQKLQYVL